VNKDHQIGKGKVSNNSQPNIENDVIKRRVRRTVDSSVCFTDVIHTTMNIEPTPAGAVDEWSIAIGRGFESQQRWLQITTAKLSTAGCYKPTQSIRPWGIYAISRPTGARHDHRLLGEKCMFRTILNSEALYRLSLSWVLAWSVEDTRLHRAIAPCAFCCFKSREGLRTRQTSRFRRNRIPQASKWSLVEGRSVVFITVDNASPSVAL